MKRKNKLLYKEQEREPAAFAIIVEKKNLLNYNKMLKVRSDFYGAITVCCTKLPACWRWFIYLSIIESWAANKSASMVALWKVGDYWVCAAASAWLQQQMHCTEINRKSKHTSSIIGVWGTRQRHQIQSKALSRRVSLRTYNNANLFSFAPFEWMSWFQLVSSISRRIWRTISPAC